MNIVMMIFAMFSGIGVLLLGCNVLSSNMEKIANGWLKKLFFKTQNNKIVGVLIGTGATAVVQSSGLTTVMVVGLVNAGIMTLAQATTLIIGANIGTTITGQIAALGAFDISGIFAGFAGVGMLINLFSKREKTKILGNIISGFGMIFISLSLMSSAISELKDGGYIESLFTSITNPFLLFLIGIISTAIMQSSSAITAILISMAAANIQVGNGGNEILYIILGTNIGSCATALLSSIGAGVNAKRASIIHLLFNFFGSIIFFIFLLIYDDFMTSVVARIFSAPSTQIAMFHTFFNVVCAIIFLPFTNVLVKISQLIIRDKEEEKTTVLDKRLVVTPSIAIATAVKETMRMLDLSVSSLKIALDGFIDCDGECIVKVQNQNQKVNSLGKELTNYLILISSKDIDIASETTISSLHDIISDIDRISELADNVIKYTDREIKESLIFSDKVKQELKEMYSLIHNMHLLTKSYILEHQKNVLKSIDEIEDNIDDMRKLLVREHIERLNKGECRPESSSVFINLANNLERVGDHISYIAHANIMNL
ncbi:MAG: Na/Pi cotransporter family protein [Coprobacillus sp.]|nr:Na/Pi cotransporter family protein [Coprobacillus sp.]MDY4146020.1 Na/Pi cotransporter family protein [Bacilli bacterium]